MSKITARNNRGGFTITETLVALVIVALLATSITTLLFAATSTDKFMRSAQQANSELMLAQRRIVYNLRTAGAVPTWDSTSKILTITKTSVGTVTYALDANNNLLESDPRYNVSGSPNILVRNIASGGFTCVISATSSSQLNTLVTVNLVVSGSPPVERHITAAVRGF